MTAKEPGRSRKVVLKFGLAGIAVVGIGAAVTTAAWTDDVWFTADASAAEFDLQGSIDGSTWLDDDVDDLSGDESDDTAIEIPATEFEGLFPGDSRTVTLHLLNAGETGISLALATAQPELTGDLFVAAAAPLDDPATVTVGAFADTTLAPGADTTFDVTVTAPDTWTSDYIGVDGTLSVLVVGTAVAAP